MSLLLSCTNLFKRNITETYTGFIVLASVMTLWTSARVFSLSLQNSDCPNSSHNSSIIYRSETKRAKGWDDIWEEYKALRELSMLINKAVGGITTCYLTEAILYYSVYMDSVFIDNDLELGSWWNKLLSLIFYFIHDGTLLMLAGNIPYMARHKFC